MFRDNDVFKYRKGLTLLEMVIAMAIMIVIMAALLPQIAAVNKSWDSRRQGSEALQNARVLTDHLNRNLAKAVRIVDASEPATVNGFLEFEDNNGDIYRYEVSGSNMVQFGIVGSLSDLAGPVSNFQFTCYADTDLDNSLTIASDGVDDIRFVKTAITMINSAALGQDKSLVASAYLRTNDSAGGGGGGSTDVNIGAKNDFSLGREAVNGMCKIDDTHYIWADGAFDDYILEINTSADSVTPITNFTYPTDPRKYPAFIQLDDTHVLKASCKGMFDGWASVITINTTDWSFAENVAGGHWFNTFKGQWPALSKIDDTHYLCVYAGQGDDGWACVLTVNPADWSVTSSNQIEYDTALGTCATISKIDDEHYLCLYRGGGGTVRAFVMTVDAGTYALSDGPKIVAYPSNVRSNDRSDIYQIDATHYLAHFSYSGSPPSNDVAILTVNDFTWTVTSSSLTQIEAWGYRCAGLGQFNATDYVVIYSHSSLNDTKAVGLTVDTSDFSITLGTHVDIDLNDHIEEDSVWATIDSTRVLCVYTGNSETFGTIFEGVGGSGALLP